MMRILVEPSDYTYQNVGDTALQQIALKRLKALFPDSSIQVFTDDPEGLALHCPETTPFSTTGRLDWLADGYLFDRLYKHLDKSWLTDRLVGFERRFRRHCPSLAKYGFQYSLRRRGKSSTDLKQYLRAISEADLVVLSGGGGITDAFSWYALGALDTLGLAIQWGVPTAILGQGIGPIKDPELLVRAKDILPKVDLISIREGRAGIPLLKSLGVSTEKIMVTGDDTIETAYQSRVEQIGKGLGVNLRVAYYSKVNQYLIEQIRTVLQDFGLLNAAPLVPIPISRVSGEEDLVTIQQLVAGYQDIVKSEEDINTQMEVIKQIHRCRVVVTGSYHAAVFALAMGIPAVGLAKSEYYIDKFLGLADLFGNGCQVVLLNDIQMPVRLRNAIQRAWELAEDLRPELLQAAAHQIKLGQNAYQQLCKITSSRSS